MAASVGIIGTTVLVTCTVASTMYECTLPLNSRSYLIQFRTNAGLLLETGGTDATLISAEVLQQIPAGQVQERAVPGTDMNARNLDTATRKIWVASTTAGTVCEITAHQHPVRT